MDNREFKVGYWEGDKRGTRVQLTEESDYLEIGDKGTVVGIMNSFLLKVAIDGKHTGYVLKSSVKIIEGENTNAL